MSSINEKGSLEQWVHWMFHEIEVKTGIDADKVSEIVTLWENACEKELTKKNNYWGDIKKIIN